ncbi:MAG: FecR domain-containing protein, partial [Halothece sp.]
MLRYTTLLLTTTLLSLSTLLLPIDAKAETRLTQAIIEAVRNRVRLIPNNQSARPASLADAINPGDALATASSSMAELRFNDGSLARLGEQVVFQFAPGTRNFKLSNGTALLLIPPGQGRTRIQTPNATAGIRGSALFVRYDAATDTTLVGALTNSGIEVFNETGTQNRELEAGHLALIVNNRIERIYEFDLETFYRTSGLVEGLDLMNRESSQTSDPALNAVRQETTEALDSQSPIIGTSVITNPNFVRLSANASLDFPSVDSLSTIEASPSFDQPNVERSNPDLERFSQRRVTQDIHSLQRGGEVKVDVFSFPGGGATGGQFPGGGATDGQFPGGGATDGQFPGGGA